MKNLFVPYEIALKLKSKGFDDPCLFAWVVAENYPEQIEISDCWKKGYRNTLDERLSAPLYQQAFKWFRKNGLKFHIREDCWNHWCEVKILLGEEYDEDNDCYPNYEEAELELIKKLIEILK